MTESVKIKIYSVRHKKTGRIGIAELVDNEFINVSLKGHALVMPWQASHFVFIVPAGRVLVDAGQSLVNDWST